jgi:hypothetical protein
MKLGLDEKVQKRKSRDVKDLPPQIDLIAEQNISFDD